MQARALGVAAATAGVAFSTTAMPAQGAHFLHLIAYAIWLVSTSNQQLAGWQSLPNSVLTRVCCESHCMQGTNVWNSFFVGEVLLPQLAGSWGQPDSASQTQPNHCTCLSHAMQA